MTSIRFTIDDAQRAHDEWGCNCGPAALAAMCDLTLDEVRRHMGDFEQKHYTNPTLMFRALDSLGARYTRAYLGEKRAGASLTVRGWPSRGLARIQWEGPWTRPGVPMAARYRQTHWVGALTTPSGNVGVWDVNCMKNGSGWVSVEKWNEILVPWLLAECHPKADGKWHITHAIELREPKS